MSVFVNDVERLSCVHAQQHWGFDIETSGLDPWLPTARILTAALTDESNNTYAFVLDHPLDTSTDTTYTERAHAIQRILGNENAVIAGHNIIAFDCLYWQVITGFIVKAEPFDTMIAFSLIDENAPSNTLLALTARYLNKDDSNNYEQMKMKRGVLEEMDPVKVVMYNAEDAENSIRIMEPLVAELRKQEIGLLFALITRAAQTLMRMTQRGIKLDVAFCEEQEHKLFTELAAITSKLYRDTGGINLSSRKQMQKLLYEDLRFPVKERTKTGLPAVDVDALKGLRAIPRLPRQAIQFLDDVLKCRKTSKKLNTYLLPFRQKHVRSDGKIHTSYHVGRVTWGRRTAGTRTGRLSSSTPNLQNIPRSKDIRGVLIPHDGYKFVDADYSQLELRVAAWYAQEKVLLNAFAEGRDIHTSVMADIEGISYEDAINKLNSPSEAMYWKNQRTLIKRVNFGILYGVGGYTLMKRIRDAGIHISVKHADKLCERWFEKHPRIVALQNAWKAQVIKYGYIKTPTGQTRRLPGANPVTPEGQHILRQAINFPIQSLAAQITMTALWLLERNLLQFDAFPVLTVHDSILVEYSTAYSREEILRVVQKTMTTETMEAMSSMFGIEGLDLVVDAKADLERWE